MELEPNRPKNSEKEIPSSLTKENQEPNFPNPVEQVVKKNKTPVVELG